MYFKKKNQKNLLIDLNKYRDFFFKPGSKFVQN